MKIHVLRHGESTFNVDERLQGRSKESVLTQKGREQILKAIEQLPEGITIVVTSPLPRAHEGAEMIANKLNVPLVVLDAFMEKDVGSVMGLTWEQASLQAGFDLKKMESDGNLDFSQFGRESPKDAKKRILSGLITLRKDHAHEGVLVVTHGGTIALMHDMFSEKKEISLPNASIHEFDIGNIEAILMDLTQS